MDNEERANQYIHFYSKRHTEIGRNTSKSLNRNPGKPSGVEALEGTVTEMH